MEAAAEATRRRRVHSKSVRAFPGSSLIDMSVEVRSASVGWDERASHAWSPNIAITTMTHLILAAMFEDKDLRRLLGKRIAAHNRV